MSEFNYGDPHPLSGDRWKAKRRSDERAASHYAGTLSEAATLYQRDADGVVTAWVDRGQKRLDKSPVEWARHLETCGAGEIFFNSIDHDGNRGGYNLAALRDVVSAVQLPVIAFVGVFDWHHLAEGLDAGAEAVAVATELVDRGVFE